MAFARARWAAELAARKHQPGTEVTLDEIYRELSERMGWEAAITATVQAMELDIEERHLRVLGAVALLLIFEE